MQLWRLIISLKSNFKSLFPTCGNQWQIICRKWFEHQVSWQIAGKSLIRVTVLCTVYASFPLFIQSGTVCGIFLFLHFFFYFGVIWKETVTPPSLAQLEPTVTSSPSKRSREELILLSLNASWIMLHFSEKMSAGLVKCVKCLWWKNPKFERILVLCDSCKINLGCTKVKTSVALVYICYDA